MTKRLLPALLAAALLAGVAPAAMAQVANDADTLALGATIDNTSFDRAQLMIGHQLQYWSPVFDTLLVREANGDIGPNMATEYTYNGDSSVLTLKLRDGITFTDGAPFDGEAVKANLEYLKSGAGQNSFMAASISEIEVVSPNEVKLHLSEPDPGLLQNLAVVGGAMASPATLGVEGSANSPIGSGPYVYDTAASVLGRQYVYVRNPNYWNAADFPFERVTITPINDNVARLNALKSGQIDAGISEARAVADAEANGLVLNRVDVDWFGLIIADREGKIAPALADLRVRKALNMAFDGASILKFVDLGYGRLTDQIFPSTSQAYVPELDEVYPFDPAAAKALLAEAGYPDGFSLTLPETTNYAAFNPIVEKFLKDIGVSVKWEKIAPNATITELRSGKFPAYVFQFGYQGEWSEIRKFGFPDSPWNTSKVADPALLELIDKVQYASGDAQNALYKDVGRYFVENAYYAPMYRRDIIYLTNKETLVDLQSTNVVSPIRNYSKAQ